MPVVVFDCFLHRRISVPNGVKLFGDFFGPEDTLGSKKAPEGILVGTTRHLGGPRSLGVPRWAVLPSEPPSGISLAQQVSSGPEKFSKKFHCVWTPFGIDFLEVTNKQK